MRGGKWDRKKVWTKNLFQFSCKTVYNMTAASCHSYMSSMDYGPFPKGDKFQTLNFASCTAPSDDAMCLLPFNSRITIEQTIVFTLY